MVSRPLRPADPLDVKRRAGDAVVGDGIVVRPVQVVRPLVDVFWPRLDGLGPAAVLPHVCHTVGREDAHHLGHRRITEILGDDEIDQIIDVRQRPAPPQLHRHLAIQSK